MHPSRLTGCLLVLALAAPAWAGGEVCLADASNGIVYRFNNLKLPKKLLASAPLNGVALSAVPAPLPLSGTVTPVDADTFVLGFMRFGSPCMIAGSLESDLSGSFSYDCNLDGVIDETADVEAVDCDTFVF
jgi:hypothetical protein